MSERKQFNFFFLQNLRMKKKKISLYNFYKENENNLIFFVLQNLRVKRKQFNLLMQASMN